MEDPAREWFPNHSGKNKNKTWSGKNSATEGKSKVLPINASYNTALSSLTMTSCLSAGPPTCLPPPGKLWLGLRVTPASSLSLLSLPTEEKQLIGLMGREALANVSSRLRIG